MNFTRAPLIDISDMSDDQAYDHGRDLYAQTYLNLGNGRGELQCHDNMTVIFYADRYEHAFKTSYDRMRHAYDKSKVALDRIRRLNWIAEFIRCAGDGVQCKEQRPPPKWKRAYYSYEEKYIVWLEPARMQDGRPTAWKFSSAYPLPIPEIKRVTHGFIKV